MFKFLGIVSSLFIAFWFTAGFLVGDLWDEDK